MDLLQFTSLENLESMIFFHVIGVLIAQTNKDALLHRYEYVGVIWIVDAIFLHIITVFPLISAGL